MDWLVYFLVQGFFEWLVGGSARDDTRQATKRMKSRDDAVGTARSTVAQRRSAPTALPPPRQIVGLQMPTGPTEPCRPCGGVGQARCMAIGCNQMCETCHGTGAITCARCSGTGAAPVRRAA